MGLTWNSAQKQFQSQGPSDIQGQDKAWAKFSKLLRKIFGRLLLQRKYADFQKFFEKCLWKNLGRSYKEDFEKGCAIFETSLETS